MSSVGEGRDAPITCAIGSDASLIGTSKSSIRSAVADVVSKIRVTVSNKEGDANPWSLKGLLAECKVYSESFVVSSECL